MTFQVPISDFYAQRARSTHRSIASSSSTASASSSDGPSTPPQRPIRHPSRPSSSGFASSAGSIRSRNPRISGSPKELFCDFSFIENELDGQDTLLKALAKIDVVGEVTKLERINAHLKQGVWKGKNDAEFEFDRPVAALTREDIVFRASTLPEKSLFDHNGRDILSKAFPSLCEAPAKMFGEDGKPLPPTKKQETSADERAARKEALFLRYSAKRTHSLIKATIIMKSRKSSWRRVRPTDRLARATRLPELPNPWYLDLSIIDGKAKRVFEIKGDRTHGACPKCTGRGLDTCVTCKGEAADACFWCSGTGREKGRGTCTRCCGQGTLACCKCSGTLLSTCGSCEGSGAGEYAHTITFKFCKIKFSPVLVSWLVSFPRPSWDMVHDAATQRVWELVQKLSSPAVHKSYVPVSAECAWDTSSTHIVEVEVPLAARLGSKKTLKPIGMARKVPTTKRYFTIPSDGDLQPAEMKEAEYIGVTNAVDEVDENVPSTLHPYELMPNASLLSQLGFTPATSNSGTPYPRSVAGCTCAASKSGYLSSAAASTASLPFERSARISA